MRQQRLANALNNGEESGYISGQGRVPRCLRLSEEIVHAIDAGELLTGDQLPGEAELAAHLPASLGTIQKPFGFLAERGVVVRRHGAGIFVAAPPNQLQDLWHFRFFHVEGKG